MCIHELRYEEYKRIWISQLLGFNFRMFLGHVESPYFFGISTIDTKNSHFLRELPFFQTIVLGIHFSFRDCKVNEVN